MLRKTSLILLGVLIVGCYAVPYLFLNEVGTWRGSFLFWAVAGLLAIVLNVIATADFKGDDT